MTIGDLIAKYTTLRAELDRYRAMVDGAQLCSEVLADLRQLEVDAGGELLSLKEAAARSGYSEDHLRRLIREGRLASHGPGRRLRLRAGDLPRKPTPVRRRTGGTYDPIEDARQLLSRGLNASRRDRAGPG